MSLVDFAGHDCDVAALGGPFPAEVEFIISAMEAAPRPAVERQRLRRSRYRVRAALRLYSDGRDAAPTVIYTRHVNSQAVGFLTDRCLHLNHGGMLSIPSPVDGMPMNVACTVLRCREVAPGWYEGAVHFNREQPCFSAERMA
jgi:hypothetical protein